MNNTLKIFVEWSYNKPHAAMGYDEILSLKTYSQKFELILKQQQNSQAFVVVGLMESGNNCITQ